MSLTEYIIDPSNYDEECLIGEGNFSSVSLVHPKNDKDTKIALKKIPFDPSDKDSQKFFIREVSIMSELNHPNLIKLIGFSSPSKEDPTFRIYTEYLPNRTLLEVLQDDEFSDASSKILTPTHRSIIIYGIASAMSFIHKKKIIHRDLKPENIFLNSEYQPILADFGLSKICNDDITMTSRLGTPYFMAPELFAEDEDGNNKITNKVDVYAFGVTLLTMFTTKYKFTGIQPRTINQLVKNITNGKRYQIPSGVPKFYVSLIERCWSNDPSKRPSFDDIIDMLERSDEFMFEGSDKKKVKEFMNKVKFPKHSEILSKSNNFSSISSEDDIEDNIEDTQEFDF